MTIGWTRGEEMPRRATAPAGRFTDNPKTLRGARKEPYTYAKIFS
jgi:hypothetical protein